MSKTVMTKSISRSSLLEFYFFFSSDITLFRIKTYIWLQDSLLRVIISVGSLVDRVLKWVCVITIVKMRSLPKLLLWPITTYRQYHGIDLKLHIGRSTYLFYISLMIISLFFLRALSTQTWVRILHFLFFEIFIIEMFVPF